MENGSFDPAETVVPINKAVISTFAKESRIGYAKHENGALYITNNYYILKTNQADFDYLMAQVNKRKRTPDTAVVEAPRILDCVNDAKGNFELTQDPVEVELGYGHTACFYADNKQYFAYNSKYVGIFDNSFNRLFVDDNASYDLSSHSLIAKNSNGEVLGIVLPIRITDALYAKLANVLPLEVKWKNEIERIKANPTNDPYIGKEFFDGRDNLIISAIKNQNGVDKYAVPRIENGEVSRYADLVAVSEIEERIALWEANRLSCEKQRLEGEKRAQQEAGIKAEYENTNGFADNLPPMQKANVLKALNDMFVTKDYGALSVKQFIAKMLADGKTLDMQKILKKKYAEMDDGDYLHSIRRDNRHSDVWGKYRAVSSNSESADSPNALWLKEHHPFLHYRLFKDKTVLDDSYFYTEYRVLLDSSRCYSITKTAYDYGNYLMANPADREQQPVGKAPPPVVEEKSPEPAPVPAENENATGLVIKQRQSPWGSVERRDKLCPGVFMVSAENSGGIMVAKDMTAALSSAAQKCGCNHNGYLCFEKNHAENVVLRELLDKKLWSIPAHIENRAAYEEKINNSLREHNPDYWRVRQSGLEKTQARQAVSVQDKNADR